MLNSLECLGESLFLSVNFPGKPLCFPLLGYLQCTSQGWKFKTALYLILMSYIYCFLPSLLSVCVNDRFYDPFRSNFMCSCNRVFQSRYYGLYGPDNSLLYVCGSGVGLSYILYCRVFKQHLLPLPTRCLCSPPSP